MANHLNPEAVEWGEKVFGMPFHDNWWQTETGGIMIANVPSRAGQTGSMGKPLPDIEAGIVNQNDDGSLREETEPMQVGELALKSGWPSMFRGYLNQEEKYQSCFKGDWYLSGDLAMKDADGYFWFVGRKDDLIKSSGHLIGPFEVESALMEHPAVAEAGVIGVPDPVAGQIVKAFVALKPNVTADEELQQSLLGLARKRLGAPQSHRKKSSFVTTCQKHAVARSCAAYLKHESWACLKVIFRLWRVMNNEQKTPYQSRTFAQTARADATNSSI
ncbi:AMP-binding protein [Vibrio sp. M60_M31a]